MGIRGFFQSVRNAFGHKKQKVAFLGELETQLGGLFQYLTPQRIYDIPEIRTAINTIAELFSVIPRYHERVNADGTISYLKGPIDRVMNVSPNPLQNPTQFWTSVITTLLIHNNAFVEIVWDENTGNISALVPLPYAHFKFVMENGHAYVVFEDANSGGGNMYDLDNIIYLNRFSTLQGGVHKQATGLYETVITAIQKQAVNVAESQGKIKAFLQNRFKSQALKKRDAMGVMKEMEEQTKDDARVIQGMVYLPGDYEIVPANWSETEVNTELLGVIMRAVYDYFGVPEKVINGTATEIEIQQFVVKRIRPLANQVEEELTRKLFTAGEIYHGNCIEFDAFNLQISQLSAKVLLANGGMLNGYLCADEAREYFGLPPLPDGQGKVYRANLNTVNNALADKYQSAKAGADGKENNENKEEKEIGEGTEQGTAAAS